MLFPLKIASKKVYHYRNLKYQLKIRIMNIITFGKLSKE